MKFFRNTCKLQVNCRIHLWKLAYPAVFVEDEGIVFARHILFLSEFEFVVDELDTGGLCRKEKFLKSLQLGLKT